MKILDFLTWLFDNFWFNIFAILMMYALVIMDFTHGLTFLGVLQLGVVLWYIKSFVDSR